MDVEIATARHLAQYEGTLYYFCSVGCRARFMRDPASYVGAGTPDRSGAGVTMRFEGTERSPPTSQGVGLPHGPAAGRPVRTRRGERRAGRRDPFQGRATVGVGFIKARFVVDMEMADLHEPDSATIKAHGQAPGSAVDATATMQLTPDGADATNLWPGPPT